VVKVVVLLGGGVVDVVVVKFDSTLIIKNLNLNLKFVY